MRGLQRTRTNEETKQFDIDFMNKQLASKFEGVLGDYAENYSESNHVATAKKWLVKNSLSKYEPLVIEMIKVLH